ncbi:MAG TPA: hypothetical protein VJO32_15595 [Ktedonobacteraceae bacterium]|nr:hypothetical protein [Ktedonobacteraceae bacterium]
MNRSKQEIRQVIKQTLLGSKNPTKRQVYAIIFMIFIHAMMIASIFVGAFLHIDFVWMLGGLWFIYTALALIIGLTDNSDRYIWQIVNQFLRRAMFPTKRDKRMGIVVGIIAGLIFLAFLITALVSGLFWLLYIALWGPIALVVVCYIWRVRDIVKQINARRQQEETA